MTKQQEAIRTLQAAEPIRTDEMAYLALRSLICLHWGKVQSEYDIRRAAGYDKALEMVLTEASPSVARALARPEALLPYWGRLGVPDGWRPAVERAKLPPAKMNSLRHSYQTIIVSTVPEATFERLAGHARGSNVGRLRPPDGAGSPGPSGRGFL